MAVFFPLNPASASSYTNVIKFRREAWLWLKLMSTTLRKQRMPLLPPSKVYVELAIKRNFKEFVTFVFWCLQLHSLEGIDLFRKKLPLSIIWYWFRQVSSRWLLDTEGLKEVASVMQNDASWNQENDEKISYESLFCSCKRLTVSLSLSDSRQGPLLSLISM